jgi:hypothetical protein
MAMSGVTQKNVMSNTNTKIKAIEATAEDLIYKEKEFVQRLSAIQETTIRCLIAELTNRPGDECDQHVKLGNFCEKRFGELLWDYVYNANPEDHEDFRAYLMQLGILQDTSKRLLTGSDALLVELKAEIAHESEVQEAENSKLENIARQTLEGWRHELHPLMSLLDLANNDESMNGRLSTHFTSGVDKYYEPFIYGWIHVNGSMDRYKFDVAKSNTAVHKELRLHISFGNAEVLKHNRHAFAIATNATPEEALDLFKRFIKGIMLGKDGRTQRFWEKRYDRKVNPWRR